MYHYRWTHDPIYASAGIVLQQVAGPAAQPEVVKSGGDAIRARQVGRLSVVGSNPVTAATIEASFRDFVAALDAHLAAGHPFLLGSRPSAADFAVLGQLHPMIALDRTTSQFIRGLSPRVCAYKLLFCNDVRFGQHKQYRYRIESQ